MGLPSPARILLLIPHLGGGGAEHVAATLARFLNPDKYEIHLGLATQLSSENLGAREHLPASVQIHALGAVRVRRSGWRILKLVWQINPALILSGMAHLNLLVLLLAPFFPFRTRIMVRQNGPALASFQSTCQLWLSRPLFRLAYRRADRIICQSNSMADELESELSIHPTKLVVLLNPVDTLGIRKMSAQPTRQVERSSRPRIVMVARLVPEKGIDLLLDAFAHLHNQFPSFFLQIAGLGPCESALRIQCRNLGIDREVEFLGQVESPALLFRDAAVFVLTSRQEGMPNALLEAAAAGLPIVATPASPGLSELLGDQPGVWVAADVSSAAIEVALANALTSIAPGQRIQHTWIRLFDLNVAIDAYESEIDRSLLERIWEPQPLADKRSFET